MEVDPAFSESDATRNVRWILGPPRPPVRKLHLHTFSTYKIESGFQCNTPSPRTHSPTPTSSSITSFIHRFSSKLSCPAPLNPPILDPPIRTPQHPLPPSLLNTLTWPRSSNTSVVFLLEWVRARGGGRRCFSFGDF